jgi:hypothetical protein
MTMEMIIIINIPIGKVINILLLLLFHNDQQL